MTDQVVCAANARLFQRGSEGAHRFQPSEGVRSQEPLEVVEDLHPVPRNHPLYVFYAMTAEGSRTCAPAKHLSPRQIHAPSLLRLIQSLSLWRPETDLAVDALPVSSRRQLIL